MAFKDNLRYLRRSNNMSQDELAARLGYKSFTTIQKWEDGTAYPRVSKLEALAGIFDVDVDHLLYEDLCSQMVKVPLVGEVKAGYDLYANQEILGYEYVNNDEYEAGEYFYLKVKGDSMKDVRICDGDIVYVHKQCYLQPDLIGVFMIDNDEVTIKKVAYDQGKIILKAANDKYPDRCFKEDEVKILGKVIHCKVSF